MKHLKSFFQLINNVKVKYYLAFGLLLSFLLKSYQTILQNFHFKWVDMDQIFMWYALKEIQEGNFHMFRYWGQNYGTMLEAWMATPFYGIEPSVLLPIVSLVLLLIPFALIAIKVNPGRKFESFFLIICFLAFLPPEYIIMGAMPRDMVSGIFITSIALLFIKNNNWYNYLIVSFLIILGWSFNANSILFGSTLLSYFFFKKSSINWVSKSIWTTGGIILGLSLHLYIQYYYSHHPEMIVHHQWKLNFSWVNFINGISHLDKFWGWLTPVFHGTSIIYLVIFSIIIALSIRNKQWNLLIAQSTLILISLLALGVNKVHDGTDSVFFSHERMYIALPITTCFLLIQLNIKLEHLKYLFPAAIISLLPTINQIKDIVNNNIAERNHMLSIIHLNDYERITTEIEDLYLSTNAEMIFFGPGNITLPWVMSRGCPVTTQIKYAVRPEYERKTWDLRALDQPIYSRFLIITPEMTDSIAKQVPEAQIKRLKPLSIYPDVFLVTGEKLNPIDVYKRLGFPYIKYKDE